MSSAIFEIINLACSIKKACDDASGTKKLLKAVGSEMSIVMNVQLKEIQTLAPDSKEFLSSLVDRLKNNLHEIKAVVDKMASMNKIKFTFQATDLQREIETKLQIFHVIMQSLNNTMLAEVSSNMQDFQATQKELQAAIQAEREEVKMLLSANHEEVLSHLTKNYTPAERDEAMDELKRERDSLRNKNKGLARANESARIHKEQQEIHYMEQIIAILSLASPDEQQKPEADQKRETPALPPSCYCPVTYELLTDPIIVDADCLHTVSRKAMLKWLEQDKATCPVCQTNLKSYSMKPNKQLRENVEFLMDNFKSDSASDLENDDYVKMSSSATSMDSVSDDTKPPASKIFSSMKTSFRLGTKTVKPTLQSSLQSLREDCKDDEATKALGYLKKAAQRDANRTAIADEGGIPVVITYMQKHIASEAVQEEACAALYYLAYNNAKNQLAVTAAGGIPVIVYCMQKNTTSAAIQAQACIALRNLAHNNTQNKDAVAAAGGIPAIVTCMQTHVTCSEVQEQACAALRSLSCSHANNQIAVAAAGGIPAIITCMKSYLKYDSIQEQACAALSNLAENANNQVSITLAGGISRILSCMKEHSKSSAIQEKGCAALRNLAYNNADIQNAISTAGGIPVIINCMEKNKRSGAVQEQSCGALWMLAYNNTHTKEAIASAGGMKAAKGAKAKYAHNDNIKKNADGLLYALKQ